MNKSKRQEKMEKREAKLKATLVAYNCGCIAKKNGILWNITNFCPEHKPNYDKKSAKLIHKLNKKTGRGYTKSSKPIDKRK